MQLHDLATSGGYHISHTYFTIYNTFSTNDPEHTNSSVPGKDTRFKIIQKMHPTAAFFSRTGLNLKRSPALSAVRMKRHWNVYFSFVLWSDVRNWISLKLNNITVLQLYIILFYMNQFISWISGVISVVLLVGKYYFHCSKWKNK